MATLEQDNNEELKQLLNAPVKNITEDVCMAPPLSVGYTNNTSDPFHDV